MTMTASPAPATRASSALACALALCAGCYTASRPALQTASTSDEFTAPPSQEPVRLVLETSAGAHVDLADYRGQALLVVAFTTDNLASQAMVRNLERVARRHPDALAVVAIAGDAGDAPTLRTLLDAYRDVAGLERVVLARASDDVRNGASVLGLIEHVPTLYFINRAGVIVRRIEAVYSEGQIEALVAPALPPRR